MKDGASSLATVEEDDDKGPVARVTHSLGVVRHRHYFQWVCA